jgi:hypothetical protein
MSKLFLSAGALAFCGFLSVSGTNAAVRLGDATAVSLASNVHKSPCNSCGLSVEARPGDMAALNAQPLPPKTYGNGRMLRR